MKIVKQTTSTAISPGSLMLLGEHAVLHNSAAIVAAVNQYLQITLQLDNTISPNKIKLSNLNNPEVNYQWTLNAVSPDPWLFITATLNYIYNNHLELPTYGLNLQSKSTFNSIGLGSSGAVIASTLMAINNLFDCNWDLTKLYTLGMNVLNSLNVPASGADLAASLFGGVIYYLPRNTLQDTSATIVNLTDKLDLTFVYSGNKVPTKLVLDKVQTRFHNCPDTKKYIYNAISALVNTAKQAILENNLSALGECFNIHQGLHAALGVSNLHLENLIHNLRNTPGILGAKISGAGLGDGIIGLGQTPREELTPQMLHLTIEPQGAHCSHVATAIY